MMSYNEFSTSDAISALNNYLPAPDNPFERAMYFSNLRWVIAELAAFYEREYDKLIEFLKNEPSDEYYVEELMKQVFTVDIAKLRELKPNIYKRIVRVKPNIAQKILSPSKLYELCAEIEGENILKYDVVNKGDLEDNLPCDEVKLFIIQKEEHAGYEVREKAREL